MLRLGASASQIGPNEDLAGVLAVVNQLRAALTQQIRTSSEPGQQPEPVPAAALEAPPAVDDEACAADSDQEGEAEAETVSNVQDAVAAQKKAEEEEALPVKPVPTPVRGDVSGALQRLKSSMALALPASPSPNTEPSEKKEPPCHGTQAPAAAQNASAPNALNSSNDASAPAVNSTTHKREYMRLVPGLARELECVARGSVLLLLSIVFHT